MAILFRKHILVVEDEPFIALDLEMELLSHGSLVSLVTSVGTAVTTIQSNPIDAAMIDHILKDGDSSPICQRLREENIPFVTYSGYPQLTGACAGAPHINKPAAAPSVVAVLKEHLASFKSQPI